VTCGKRKQAGLPERQDYYNRWSLIGVIKSCLSGSIAVLLVRRSLTCGYENHVLSGLFNKSIKMLLKSCN
jgi:hypothetical protein